jgi:hypothetical protein
MRLIFETLAYSFDSLKQVIKSAQYEANQVFLHTRPSHPLQNMPDSAPPGALTSAGQPANLVTFRTNRPDQNSDQFTKDVLGEPACNDVETRAPTES